MQAAIVRNRTMVINSLPRHHVLARDLRVNATERMLVVVPPESLKFDDSGPLRNFHTVGEHFKQL